MKLSMMTKKYATGSVIQFLQNRFYFLWCLQRPPASVGVYELQPKLIESSGDENISDSMPTPVRSDFADFVLFALTDANESQKINLKCLIYSREISRNVGYSLYKGHFMVKVRSDF